MKVTHGADPSAAAFPRLPPVIPAVIPTIVPAIMQQSSRGGPDHYGLPCSRRISRFAVRSSLPPCPTVLQRVFCLCSAHGVTVLALAPRFGVSFGGMWRPFAAASTPASTLGTGQHRALCVLPLWLRVCRSLAIVVLPSSIADSHWGPGVTFAVSMRPTASASSPPDAESEPLDHGMRGEPRAMASFR